MARSFAHGDNPCRAQYGSGAIAGQCGRNFPQHPAAGRVVGGKDGLASLRAEQGL